MIEFENVKLIFAKNTPLEKQVLKNINLKIKENDFVTLIGGNGAGKSSLLNLISGQIIPSSGSINIGGKNLNKMSLTEKSKIISKVFQDPITGTFADLTVLENLALAKYKYCKNKFKNALGRDFIRYIKGKLATLPIELSFKLTDTVRLLSGGQRQVLSLLMATLYPGKILLLDEITASLDPEATNKVLNFAQNLIKEYNLTVLMVTHSMSFALKFGNRTLILQSGQIVKDINLNSKKNMQPADLLAYFEV